MKRKNIQNQLLIVFLAVGFFVGILYENIFLKWQNSNESILQISNLNLVTEEYLLRILWIRIVPIIVLCILGRITWRKVLIAIGLLWTGFLIGVLTVMSVMSYGIRGILFCLIGLLPHMLFYGLAYGVVIIYFYRYPDRQWNSGKTIFVVLTLFIGMILESYLTPLLLKWFLL